MEININNVRVVFDTLNLISIFNLNYFTSIT